MVTETFYGFINADGTMQVESNDRGLRILLKRSTIIDEGQQLEVFHTEYYVKDGFEWQKAINSANYKSAEEFIDAISNSEEFTSAVLDIEEQRKRSVAGG